MSLDLTACSDGELAGLAVADSQAAFREIMRRHREPIYRLIRGYTGDGEEALDLTQDSFASAFQHLRSYDQSRSFRAWLVQVALNKSRDFCRRRRVRQILSFANDLGPNLLEASADEAPGPDDTTFFRAQFARLSRAIAELPAPLKETLLLRTIEGFSQAETALALSISEKAVETRLARARTKLRKVFPRD